MKKSETRTLVADLRARLDRIVSEAVNAGRTQALSEIRALVGEVPAARRGPGRPPKSASAAAPAAAGRKTRKKRKNPWAHMTAEQRAERVRKMLAGRGLKPKGER
jgi:hypothetical protein